MYKVRVLRRNEYAGYDNARLNISVGQAYHEGAKLEAAVDWLNNKFRHVDVNICDTLQRHNFEKLGISHLHAREMALAAGEAWLERNKVILDRLGSYSVVRWDHWLAHPEYKNAILKVHDLFKNDPDFAAIINHAAHGFVMKSSDSENYDQYFMYSQRYLLEESAVALLMGQHNVADIYPSSYLPMFDYLNNLGLCSLKSMTSISFRRLNNIQSDAA